MKGLWEQSILFARQWCWGIQIAIVESPLKSHTSAWRSRVELRRSRGTGLRSDGTADQCPTHARTHTRETDTASSQCYYYRTPRNNNLDRMDGYVSILQITLSISQLVAGVFVTSTIKHIFHTQQPPIAILARL